MHGEAFAPRYWWQTRWFVLLAALLATVPLLRPDIPPLVDLLGHLGRYRVQLDGAHYPWLGEWYGFRWALIGNLGVDLLVQALGPILGLEPAVKLIVLSIPMLTVIGLLTVAHEAHGRIPATALFALPLAYNYPFQFGFVNFSLSMALALCVFALWLRLGRLGHFRARAILFVPLSCLVWVCHAFGWGLLSILIFSVELIRARDSGARWAASILRTAANCLPLVLPFVLTVMWRGNHGVGGETLGWAVFPEKMLWLAAVLRGRWITFDIVSTAVMYSAIVVGLLSRDVKYSRKLALASSLLFSAFLILPRVLFGSYFADMRLAPFAVALAILALEPRPSFSLAKQRGVALVGLALFAARLSGETYSYHLFDQRYRQELQALDHIPVGARLISFVGSSCRNHWMASRLDHLPGIALERRLAYSNDQWSLAGAQLLSNRYRAAGEFASDPSQFAYDARCPRPYRPTLDESLTSFPRAAFDYVWLIAPPSYATSSAWGLIPIWRSGASVLFRIDHRVDSQIEPRDIDD